MIIKDIYYKFKYADEVTANGILENMANDLVVSYTVDIAMYPKVWTLAFSIDDFSIVVTFSMNKKYVGTISVVSKIVSTIKLAVDDLELVCSYSIKEKIFNKASDIFNKKYEKLEEQRMLRKDIKLRFGGKL